jgi:DNA-binding transcriptional LysR family regulator
MGEIAVGFGSTPGIHIVPKLLRNLHERYPDIRLKLKEMGTAAQLAGLRRGEIDVAISHVVPTEELCLPVSASLCPFLRIKRVPSSASNC